eukprot:scaffold7889_cov497-Prasinococcus_capsulatus_cf.AAC.2
MSMQLQLVLDRIATTGPGSSGEAHHGMDMQGTPRCPNHLRPSVPYVDICCGMHAVPLVRSYIRQSVAHRALL